MGVVFKYKNKMNRSYAPGFVFGGKDGSTGKTGENGNSVHFIDYDIDNTYYLELTLQKIENNQLLNTSQNTSLDDDYKSSMYKTNDLIISNSGTCYKITNSSDKSLFKNFSYDIVKIGKFANSNKSQAPKKIIIYNISDKRIFGRTYNSYIKSCYPNHSLKNSNLDKNYNFYTESIDNEKLEQEYFSNKCEWFKFACIVDDDVDINDLTSEYSYSLEIYLANDKAIDFNEGPLLDNSDCKNISFFKKIEISNLALIHEDDEMNSNVLLDLKDYCFTDFNFDTIHPSGNNIKCTLDKNRWMWLNSNISKSDSTDIKLGDIHYNIKTINKPDDNDNDSIVKAKVLKDNYIKSIQANNGSSYLESDVIIHTYDSGETKHIKKDFDLGCDSNWYPTHSAGGSLDVFTETDIQKALDKNDKNDNGDIIQYSKHSLRSTTNLLSGNSLYFSSISDSNEFKDELLKYLTNPDNKIYLVATNLKTKKTIVSEVAIASRTLLLIN